MYVVIVNWAVSPQDRDAFAALLQKQAKTTLAAEPAARVFDICEDPDQPGAFLLYEVYDTAAAFQEHLASAHFATFAPLAEAMTLVKTVKVMHRLPA